MTEGVVIKVAPGDAGARSTIEVNVVPGSVMIPLITIDNDGQAGQDRWVAGAAYIQAQASIRLFRIKYPSVEGGQEELSLHRRWLVLFYRRIYDKIRVLH
ncbi:hypothetical protein O9929_20740 [Vibrio lentus]|nr:hypothetical protein [Vibrio lentus]